MVSIGYERITSRFPKFLAFEKVTFEAVSTVVLSVNLNSAPILFLVVSIEVVTFCAKSDVDSRKNNMYSLVFIF
jgi:hypothetical protein